MNKWTIIHIHNTPMFYVETQIEIKPWNVFSYMSWRITFIGSTNFLCFQLQLEGGSNLLVSQATTWGKLQLPNSLTTTRRRLQPPIFSGYNWKVATTTCSCPILPPWSRSTMMEPLSTCHCEIYCCKPVPINMNHASTMHQHAPQPVINLHHR